MDDKVTAENVATGQIFSYVWGMEQTNVDWFEVLTVTKTRKSATFRRIKSIEKESGKQSMVGESMPDIGNFMDGKKPFRKLLKEHDGELYIGMDYGSLRPWNGKPKRYSSYA